MFPAACKWDDPSKKKKMKIGVEKYLFEWVGADTEVFRKEFEKLLRITTFNYSVFTLLHRDIYH